MYVTGTLLSPKTTNLLCHASFMTVEKSELS